MAAPGRITHPEGLRAELANVRRQYNTVRLDAGVGYVTPDDEHQGHGPRIRAARKRGLRHARWARITYHRIHNPKPTAGAPPMWTNSLPDLWL
jgi:putative transposase